MWITKKAGILLVEVFYDETYLETWMSGKTYALHPSRKIESYHNRAQFKLSNNRVRIYNNQKRSLIETVSIYIGLKVRFLYRLHHITQHQSRYNYSLRLRHMMHVWKCAMCKLHSGTKEFLLFRAVLVIVCLLRIWIQLRHERLSSLTESDQVIAIPITTDFNLLEQISN